MKIRTKNQKFTGRRAGIDFRDGVGELRDDDERVAAQLERLGYTVENEHGGDGEGAGGEHPLDGLTVEQLKAHAAEQGIDLDGATKKADIIAAIDAA